MTTSSNVEQTPKQLNQWLKSQRRHSQGRLSIAIACGSINGILMIVQMAFLAAIVNQIVFQQQNIATISPWLQGLAGVVIFRALFGYGSERYSRYAAMQIKLAIRQQLLQQLFAMGPRAASHIGTAKIAQILHQGVDSLEDYFSGYLPIVAYCAVIPTAVLFAVFPMDWQAGLILSVTAPLVPIFMIIIGHKAHDLNQQHWAKLLRMSTHFLDIIQGLTQLKIFNASRKEMQAVKTISDDYGNQTMDILKVAFLSSFMLEFLASVAIALVAVTLGFRLYYGHVDYLLALWVLLLAPEFYLPFRQLGAQYHAKMAGVTAAQDMLAILMTPTSTNHSEHHSTALKNHGNDSNTNSLSGPFTLALADVNFTYPGRPTTLTDINLTFSGPGLYAIVGESGAGKSTLIDMILGFISPDSGTIKINQQRYDQELRDQWLQHCGWIAQHGHIFYGSLGFNVALTPDYDTVRVNQVLCSVGLDGLVASLNQGLDSHVGDSGTGLSGGQAQRLALARAFYHQPDVLILDEPSSHLDKDTEMLVSRTIAEYAKDHLVIVIAHRLSTVTQAKSIIAMAQGQIIEQGNHAELIEQQGWYAQMLNINNSAVTLAETTGSTQSPTTMAPPATGESK